MRDAFGGVFTMNLLLVFIFIYVAVTAVSLNYAKAFKAKNAVIDFVEQQEITDLETMFGAFSGSKKDKLTEKLKELSYHITCEQIGKEDSSLITGLMSMYSSDEYCYNGVVFKENRRQKIEGTTSEIIYYDIKTYAAWNLGAFNKILALSGQKDESDSPLVGTWAITGEAKVVVKN